MTPAYERYRIMLDDLKNYMELEKDPILLDSNLGKVNLICPFCSNKLFESDLDYNRYEELQAKCEEHGEIDEHMIIAQTIKHG